MVFVYLWSMAFTSSCFHKEGFAFEPWENKSAKQIDEGQREERSGFLFLFFKGFVCYFVKKIIIIIIIIFFVVSSQLEDKFYV